MKYCFSLFLFLLKLNLITFVFRIIKKLYYKKLYFILKNDNNFLILKDFCIKRYIIHIIFSEDNFDFIRIMFKNLFKIIAEKLKLLYIKLYHYILLYMKCKSKYFEINKQGNQIRFAF